MPRRPRSDEDVAAFIGLGQVVTSLREAPGMNRDELAEMVEEDRSTLMKIERGEVDANWATLRALARALDCPLDRLMELAEESAPGKGGEEWRRWTREAERERAVE